MRDYRLPKGWKTYSTNDTAFCGVFTKQESAEKDAKAYNMIKNVKPIVIIKKDKKNKVEE